jgi:D-alanine--poly(phosphoribitol) ligase subunit 1
MSVSLDRFFTQSASAYPARPALAIGNRSWSYGELDAECRLIEHALAATGVGGRQGNIGLVYARSMFTYAAIIAIMRSNSVYVPLNPKMPAERLLRIIEDAQLEAVVLDTHEALPEGVLGALRQSKPLPVIVPGGPTRSALEEIPQHALTSVGRSAERRSIEPTAEPVTSGVAYIIYTSGSTGISKGVPITHAAACACIEKSYSLFETREDDRFSQFSALSFDVSILDLFLCWRSGAALCVPETSEALIPLKFANTQKITVWSSVPSLANGMLKLRLLKSNALANVRLALFCGEALPCELARAFTTAAPGCTVVNLYGPTECTIFATCHTYDPRTDPAQGTVLIGGPLPGMRCLVVDEGRVVEENEVPGELWLSGDQLAGGYWKNPAATEAAFVQFPTGDPRAGVWYRTGDLVSWVPSTALSFRGRIDRQIKLRGHRVELQEIESAVREVAGCALVAIVPLRTPGGICEAIVAWCDKLSTDEATLKERCLTRIPRYMVPDRILELDTFPLSSSGKIDYLALAAHTTRSQTHVA